MTGSTADPGYLPLTAIDLLVVTALRVELQRSSAGSPALGSSGAAWERAACSAGCPAWSIVRPVRWSSPVSPAASVLPYAPVTS